MKERGAAAQVANNEQRFFDRLFFMAGKKDIIQEKAEPMDQLPDWPDRIKHDEEYNALACKMGGCVFRCKK